MAKPIGPKKVHRYSDAFKATAVKLSELSGVQVQHVAEALDVHPFMLSRWRKEYREGRLVAGKAVRLEPKTGAELKRLRELERAHAILQEEHASSTSIAAPTAPTVALGSSRSCTNTASPRARSAWRGSCARRASRAGW